MNLYYWFHDGVTRVVPLGLRKKIRRTRARWMSKYGRWRIRRPATAILGPQFRRSLDRLELDITYACNLHCFNCNRSCEQARTNEHMSVGQIRHFLAESRERGQKWRMIRVIGGEPTIHPQFLKIIELLAEYRRAHSTNTRIVVCTNGYGDKVQRTLAMLPPEIVIENSSKESPIQPAFMTFNIAPVDSPEFADAEYTNGCSIIKKCGFGLGPSGYYPCGPASGIDRIFGFNLGRQTLPAPGDDMREELRKFCSVCGIFKRSVENQPLINPVMSATWSQAYANWAKQRPQLPRYPEAPPAESEGS
jgi:hypothetical protein